jgi:putative flippase GtrA
MTSTKGDVAGCRTLYKLTTFRRSLLTSLFTTALDFGTLVSLTEIVGINYVVSTWIGTIVGALSNFTINKRWAFSARAAPVGPALWRFALIQLGASGLHTAGVWAVTRFGDLAYPVSKLVVAAVVYLGWNYPLNRWFVFHPRHQVQATEGPTQRS